MTTIRMIILAAVSLTAGLLTYVRTVRREAADGTTEAEQLQAACLRASKRHLTRSVGRNNATKKNQWARPKNVISILDWRQSE